VSAHVAAVATDRIERIQEALREDGLAGWLLFDFRGSNPIARSVLGLASAPNAAKTTRRWFYFVPARGEPRKLVHRIEPRVLDHLPGESAVYLAWEELDRELKALVERAVSGHATAGGFAPAIAMEYSPEARLPYVSKVDAGTVELVRAAGAQVVTSADLAQRFDGVLVPEARRDHVRTGILLDEIIVAALGRARDAVRSKSGSLTEMGLQRFILERFDAAGLISAEPPTVAVNAHSGDPHFTNTSENDAPLRAGDFLLIDAWAKKKAPGAIYADYTQVASLAAAPPERQRAVFAVVRDARDTGVACVREALAAGRTIRGCDVDDAARSVVREAGYGDRFLHRLGHSIGEETHANGVHLDNLETRDERRLLEGSLVSVEPGIYLDDFGVRSEVNLLIDGGKAVVTPASPQRELPALLA
jgi:Xaa-Pro aminopeptidase